MNFFAINPVSTARLPNHWLLWTQISCQDHNSVIALRDIYWDCSVATSLIIFPKNLPKIETKMGEYAQAIIATFVKHFQVL